MQKFDVLGGIMIGVSLLIITFSLVLNWHQAFRLQSETSRTATLNVTDSALVTFDESISARRMLISQIYLDTTSLTSDDTSFTRVHKTSEADKHFILTDHLGNDVAIADSKSILQADTSLSIVYKNQKWWIEEVDD